MIKSTLCYLIKENHRGKKLLLAMKKKGFGKGKWNGIGGTWKKEKGDRTITDTAIREVKEEISTEPKEIEKVAILNFNYPYSQEHNQDTYVFIVKKWQREPKETKEMRPEWFSLDRIPFDKMWDDDRFWLPLILEDKKIKANFIFREGGIVESKEIQIVQSLV